MRHAFLHKNFRELNFEKKAVLISHVLTLIFCWFPWFEASKDYIPTFNYNAFSGPGFLIGTFVFLISLLVVVYFLDRLFESERVKLPMSENSLFFAAGALQILLIVLAWSVLFSVGRDFSESGLRFGIFLTFVSQVAGLVATFLNAQLDRQTQARAFFRAPGNDNQEE